MKNIFRSFLILGITIGAITSGFIFVNRNTKTVLAVGDLSVNFHVPVNAPIFTVNNMAPGDPAQVRTVDVTNGGSIPHMVSVKGVRTGGGGNPRLENVLDIVIKENGTPLYGTGSSTGARTVAQFFSDSSAPDGIKLNTVNPNQQKTYTFTVSFPSSAGNEYQAKSVIFNLVFGQVTGDNVLINEVYYMVDQNHGLDSPKDRGIQSVNGNSVKLSIKNNGVGSLNTINVNQQQACQLLQSNATTSNTTITSSTNTGKNSITNSTTSITTGSSTSQVNVTVNGGTNISPENCGKMLGQNDEWIELYNPTDHDINLKNWYFMDNSGFITKINATRIIKAGGYALVSKDESPWQNWNENSNTLKIPLGSEIGDGLNNSGDRVILFSNTGVEQDRMSWGTDTTGFTPAAILSPVPIGSSSERNVPGIDTNTVSDWKISTPPTP